MAWQVDYDPGKCNSCGECVEICPQGVWEMGDDDKAVYANPDECIGCESCVEACEPGAISGVREV